MISVILPQIMQEGQWFACGALAAMILDADSPRCMISAMKRHADNGSAVCSGICQMAVGPLIHLPLTPAKRRINEARSTKMVESNNKGRPVINTKT